LKNSDYGLAYYYLPKRINFGIEGFHTARFVYLSRNFGTDLFRFRNFGGVVSASYPLNRFYRLDGSLGVFSTSSENLDDYSEPSKKRTFIIPSLSFVHDNTLFGYTSPIEGTRYKFTLFGNPGINDSERSFYSFLWDYRTYLRFWFDNHFAFRFSGGYSAGANPQRFFIGGTDNWINREFATGEVPIEDPEDFAFFTPGLPLRGYDFAEQIGSKYSLMNLELRMPLIRYLVTGPLPFFFQNILGTAFIDVGSAWNDNEKLQFFAKDENGNTVTKDLLIGTGVGFRLYFLFLWKMDIAWKYNVDSFSEPRYYFSIGLDF
jgi:outer membrane protein assembly factor BamA